MPDLLKLEALRAGYGEAVVLPNMSLTLPEGQVLALLGRNGTGKTTLINSIVGITRRFGGSVALGGVDLTAMRADQRARAGIGWGDLALVELNEAFAAQSLACLAEWPELDPEIVNVNGGAIALGHALGNSGTRLLTTLAWELRRRGGRWGLAAMCIGVGQGVAMVIEA